MTTNNDTTTTITAATSAFHGEEGNSNNTTNTINTSIDSYLFAENDEETLTMLLSASEEMVQSKEMQHRFQGMGGRFIEDHDSASKVIWDNMVRDVVTTGMTAFTQLDCYQHHTPSSGRSNAVRIGDTGQQQQQSSSQHPTTIPMSLSSETGKLHIKAVRSILEISEISAIQLTMGVFLQQDSMEHALESLGTKSLLQQTCQYYFRQRVARISIVAELVRRNDQQITCHSLDDATTLSTTTTTNAMPTQKRGLWRMLLTAACQPDTVVQRHNFLPAQELLQHNINDKINRTLDHTEMEREELAWKELIRTILESKRSFQQRERLAALEALLVLLYDRVIVQRVDLAVMVTAFHKHNFFDTEHRFASLAGLICVESMALWRVFNTTSDDMENNPAGMTNKNTLWREEHPLLHNLFTDPVVHQELQALQSFFQLYIRNIDDRWTVQHLQVDSLSSSPPPQPVAPESIAMLAFGLLLHAAGTNNNTSVIHLEKPAIHPDEDFQKKLRFAGLQMATLANSEYDAFGYLHRIMKEMVLPVVPRSNQSVHDILPYDYIAFHGTDKNENPGQLVLHNGENDDDDDDGNELSAPTLAYASIGRELLTAGIRTFQETILPAHRLALPENVKQLSELVAAIFCNSPTLCSHFWSDWEAYTLDKEDPVPLCCLLKSAHRLATKALQATSGMNDESILNAITPLLELVASLTYDSDNLQEVLTAILPSDLIRRALSILNSKTGSGQSESFVRSRQTVLVAISVLARIGKKKGSRVMLRDALEEPGMMNNDIQSPRILVSIATKSRNVKVVAQAFGILADLVQGAPFGWIFDSIRALSFVQSDGSIWRNIFEEDAFSTYSTVQFLHTLVCHLNKLVFSPLLDERVITELLSVLTSAVSSSSALLPVFISTMSPKQQAKQYFTSYSSSACIMDTISALLRQLRFMVELHKSQFVIEAAVRVFDSVLGSLAAGTGIGDAVSFFATVPVTLSLASTLDESLHDIRTFHTRTNNTDGGSIFTSIHRADDDGELLERARALCLKQLHESECEMIDIDEARRRGWLEENDDNEELLLLTSRSALRLMNCWAKSVAVETSQTSVSSGGNPSVDIFNLSPIRLLVAPCILPPQFRGNILLAGAWSKAGILTFDVVLKFLGKRDQSIMEVLLAVETLDLLAICLFHQQHAASNNPVTTSTLSLYMSYSLSFRKLSRANLEKTLFLLEKKSLSSYDKLSVSVNLRFLRLLCLILDTNPSVAARILSGENDLLLTSLVDAVSQTLVTFSATNTVVADHSVDQMRLTVGILSILGSIWRHGRTQSSDDKSDGRLRELRSIVQDHTSLFQNLSHFIFNSASLIYTENDVSDNHVQHSRQHSVFNSLLCISCKIVYLIVDCLCTAFQKSFSPIC